MRIHLAPVYVHMVSEFKPGHVARFKDELLSTFKNYTSSERFIYTQTSHSKVKLYIKTKWVCDCTHTTKSSNYYEL